MNIVQDEALRTETPVYQLFAGGEFPHHSQWVAEAQATTSYEQGWEASCLVGPPRVYPQHGDIPGAWAAASSRCKLFYPSSIVRILLLLGFFRSVPSMSSHLSHC